MKNFISSLKFKNLEQYKTADVPRFPGMWKAIGAGVIWAAIGQGSGELIWWPYLTAKYQGFFLCWMIPACYLGYWVNLEVIRYTANTGENIFTGFIRLNKFFSLIMWIMMIVTFLWFGGYASAGGTALAAIFNFPSGWSPRSQSLFWGYLTIAVYSIPIWLAPVVYKWIENIMKVIALATVVGLIVVLFDPRIIGNVMTFAAQLLNFKLAVPANWDGKDAEVLITAITFTGMGGYFTLMYSYWIRDKGVGMAAYSGRITSPITGRTETIPATGYIFNDNPDNKKNFKKWKKSLFVDNIMGVSINTVTLLILALLSWSLLMPSGTIPKGWDIAVVQSEFFQFSWGTIGKILFLIIAAAFLSDTWLGVADAISRMNADFIYSNDVLNSRKLSFRQWYYISICALTVITCFTMALAPPGTLILVGGILNFFAMVIYCPALIYLNYFKMKKVLPEWTQPSKFEFINIVLASLCYFILFIIYLYNMTLR